MKMTIDVDHAQKEETVSVLLWVAMQTAIQKNIGGVWAAIVRDGDGTATCRIIDIRERIGPKTLDVLDWIFIIGPAEEWSNETRRPPVSDENWSAIVGEVTLHINRNFED